MYMELTDAKFWISKNACHYVGFLQIGSHVNIKLYCMLYNVL